MKKDKVIEKLAIEYSRWKKMNTGRIVDSYKRAKIASTRQGIKLSARALGVWAEVNVRSIGGIK